MSAFPNWQKYAVAQKRPATGCIPTAYELLLRASNASGIDFSTFQDDFDLDRNGGAPQNNFASVAAAVQGKYPSVNFKVREFMSGAEKLEFVERRLEAKQPTIVALTLESKGGWHIMPVVDADQDSLTLLWSVDTGGSAKILSIKKAEFVRVHDEWPGGKDVAYLESH